MALITAVILDLFIGDPVYAWHPVRLMGKAIHKAEAFLRAAKLPLKSSGFLLALLFPLGIFFGLRNLMQAFNLFHPVLSWILNVLGIYTAISIRDLYQEAARIYKDLKKQDLEQARHDLTRIVGRDTRDLDEKEVVRASVETVAESTLDGVVAPLFYAAIGGMPLALAYKAANTLDSMIGHRNEQYRDFGWAAAKLDDFWNWIPARLSYVCGAVAAVLLRYQWKNAWKTGWKDGVVWAREVSSVPEATFAGALGVRLGGLSSYAGRPVSKRYLGQPFKEFHAEDLKRSLEMMFATSFVFLSGIFFIQLLWRLVS